MSTLRAAAVAALVLAAACPAPNYPHDLQIRQDVPSGGDAFSNALMQSVRVPMLPGNAVDYIENGRIFDAIEEEILNAHSSINIFSYIWRPGVPSSRLLNALRARRPGVACRIIVEPIGSPGFEDNVRQHLEDAGCDVRLFRPYNNPSPRLFLSRTHRKYLVFDGKVGITGGFGIWRSWEGNGLTPGEWRDNNVRVLGPAVREMQIAFGQNWQEVGGELLPPQDFPKLEPVGTARAAFVTSTGDPTITDSERLLQLMIASARKRLWIACAYFIPPDSVIDSLVRKAKEGVDVRVIAPGPNHDQSIVRAGQRSRYKGLLRGGVRIYEYGPSMYHPKTILVDDRLALIGSANIDTLALRRNEEAGLVIEDPEIARNLDASYRRDLRHSVEIRWDSWRRRGYLDEFVTSLSTIIGGIL